MSDRIYRCSDGHYYSAGYTKGLLKSVHFGMGKHLQRCPVDGKWRMASPVAPNELSEAQRAEAERYRF